jgi:hypothetical protein
MVEVKYFQAQVNHIVSNGKLKFKFSQEVLRVDNKLLIDLLSKSKTVKEVSEEEAQKLNPSLFENYEAPKEGGKPGKTSNDGSGKEDDNVVDLSDMTKPELKAEATKLGVSEDELKEPIMKDALIAIVEKAQAEAAKKAQEEKDKA